MTDEQPTDAALEAQMGDGAAVDSAAVDAPVAAPVEDPAAIAAARAEREKKRLRQTVRDMVLSMGVVALVVIALVAPWNWSQPDPVRVVDTAPVVTAARTTVSWPVLAPTSLPATWRATSARIERSADDQPIVHLGWLTPSEQYLGLEQSATKVTSFVRDVTLTGTEQGTSTVAGEAWTRMVSADGTRRSLVRTEGEVTYVVTGGGDWAEVEGFTATLSAG